MAFERRSLEEQHKVKIESMVGAGSWRWVTSNDPHENSKMHRTRIEEEYGQTFFVWPVPDVRDVRA